MTIQAIRHTGIVVSDMDRSLPLYRDLLGMEVWADFKDDSAYVQAIASAGANPHRFNSDRKVSNAHDS